MLSARPHPIIEACRIALALKPDGRLVIIEFAELHPFGPQDKAERMTLNQIRGEIEPTGFDLDQVMDLLPIQHGLIFNKRLGH